MSMGYIPKKRLYVRRMRRLRKKYKNFSCETCAEGGGCYKKTTPIGIIVGNFKNCSEWKAKKDEKNSINHKTHKKSKSLKTFFEKFSNKKY